MMRSLLLLAATSLNLAAIPASSVLTLVNDPIPGQPGKNYSVLDIEVSGPDITTDTATSTLTGTVLGIFNIESGLTSVMTLANGIISGSDFSASGTVSVFTITGPYTLDVTGLAGTFETPNPPGTVTSSTGEFAANQHKLTVNQGSVTGSALGQNLFEEFSAEDPFEGTGTGTGSVTFTPTGSSGIYDLFDVEVIVPGISAIDSITVGTTFTTTVTVEGTGTIKAIGTLQVPKSEYLAWTLAEGITGADGQADANSDGIPNAVAWALGLGAFDNAQNHVLRTAFGGYQINLPPGGTAAPITIEGSDLSSPFLPISAARISTPQNPLPPGSSGLISINHLAGQFLRLKVDE